MSNTKIQTTKKVTIYTTPSCHFCHMVKELLKKHYVRYEEIDVKEDLGQRQAMILISGQMGVPVIVIEDEDEMEPKIMVGFDKEKLLNLLDIK